MSAVVSSQRAGRDQIESNVVQPRGQQAATCGPPWATMWGMWAARRLSGHGHGELELRWQGWGLDSGSSRVGLAPRTPLSIVLRTLY